MEERGWAVLVIVLICLVHACANERVSVMVSDVSDGEWRLGYNAWKCNMPRVLWRRHAVELHGLVSTRARRRIQSGTFVKICSVRGNCVSRM